MGLLDRFRRTPAAESVSEYPTVSTQITYDVQHTVDATPTTAFEVAPEIEAAGPMNQFSPGSYYARHDGEKFDGGLGPVPLLFTDYWALRERSASFFKTNAYGRGIIRRLVTNVINKGLSLEAAPNAELLAFDDDEAAAWADDVENRWEAWASQPDVCDFRRESTFGELQRDWYREALIEGDILIVERHNPRTQLPYYESVSGSLIQTPLNNLDTLREGHTVEWGVELNAKKEQVAYWVLQKDLTHRRIPARGRGGRRQAWLFYGTDKRKDDVRGEPLLALIMQYVSEIDKYKDATQRKAVINAMLAMFFYHSPDSKTQNSRPVSASANRRVRGSSQLADGSEYKFDLTSQTPGVTYEYLPKGLEPKGFTADGTDEKFGDFEHSILKGIAWALEMPVSILEMVFGSSYSASRGEIKEFNMFLNKDRERVADTQLRPVYRSWVTAMALTRRIEAPGLLDSARDPMRFEEFGAWVRSNWWGAVKEAVDLPKEVNGQKAMAENGYTTNNAASRALTGTKFRDNIKQVARENQQKAEAMRPLLELEQEFGEEAVARANVATLSLVANSGDNDG